ncbi:putative tail tubular protein A [Alteromonas phage vB_AmeP_R8W]|uniref:Putative tail tubular protein A n=1 Tax=Alteromonas phage vB_AmeP_R8W TaxID=2774152 RepID=A0A8E4RFZ1_9CAUD|nr:putative tail tubular protein A [Alteromonas phage vB_AmeP_R8W]
MDELEALNMLLRLIGSSPVNSLDTPHPDAANAKVTLDRVRRQTQRTSWWFNTDYGVTLYRDDKNEIVVPKEYASVVFVDDYLVLRGGKVYNKINQTNKHESDVEAYLVIQTLDWDNMPKIAQDYCAYTAGAQFIRDELEDSNKARELKEDAARSYVDLKNQDLTENKYNMFNKARVVKARAGVRPYSQSLSFLRQK